ncbi:polyprenyl synthetase family protein [Aquabacterium sp. A08]|uniref:polyprenyl synthetase family protein n=1 Tax=Aquabacterium sp. A08 TaxID=2718532 RepID=UPI001423E49C|nr:farnesyl diphosphate synthase [Aquabacterium sp. A08]NIC41781.1 polyprenyl synthetase family protein [Aquabacterium sp. A08]NIC41810.1 polyprenyl synthetase family protein [Aquabacterium sp. A08]
MTAPQTLPPLDFAAWTARQLAAVERALEALVPADAPAGLGEAMRYAVLDGGKRLRPLLTLATAQAVAGDPEAALPEPALRAACAVELIHAYSLVHDDLPCMDNDVLRRGKPTVHVRFGEAQALLAGDALQALAFELLLPEAAALDEVLAARLCRTLARAAGHEGMAGGQAIDLAGVGQVLTQPQLEDMHRRKTGALLLASVRLGALAAGAAARQCEALDAYGRALGLAFQVVDDVLDVTADSATLGKTAGKDAAADKPTFVALLGLDGARAYADGLLAQALEALDRAGLPDPRALAQLAHGVVQRTH